MNLKEKGVKKVKFYDRILIAFFILLAIWILLFIFSEQVLSLFPESQHEIVAIVSGSGTIILLILLGIFILGMAYHAYRREEYTWAFFNLIITILPFIYYSKLRKEFKKGNIEYKSKWEEHDLELR